MASKEQQLIDLLKPVIEALGFEFWGLEYIAQGNNSVLRVFIDSENGIHVDDCALVSRQVSGIMDVEDPISSEYNLEVSSPGVDRPLFTLEHYKRYVGEFVDVKLRYAFEGRRKFKGKLVGIEDDEDIVVHVDDHEYLLPIDAIDKASLIFQDHKGK
ncbi:ribosome maturation factor RimP [Bermanella sp. WJH001]|uniref:ribosome maturation factor RimP n=1 Tax=Bermanella sp. WJH001 TaxID=3048005 RepID=UPI0024BF0294|nr:ribosome maturation factor RimP [Bermanella sp. WJH001]MDJ1538287.1 ribosome maturation factor RimP [Bermanella sp. WJH001]